MKKLLALALILALALPFAALAEDYDIAMITDIGTIAFEEGGRLVDLMGLARPDVALKKVLRLNHALTEDEVTFITHGVSLAIINDD